MLIFQKSPGWSNVTFSNLSDNVHLSVVDCGWLLIINYLGKIPMESALKCSGSLASDKTHLFSLGIFNGERINIHLETMWNNWFLDKPSFFLYTVVSQLLSSQESLDCMSGIFGCWERNEFLWTHDIASYHHLFPKKCALFSWDIWFLTKTFQE